MRSDAKAFAEDKLLLKLPASPFSDERVFGNKPDPELDLSKVPNSEIIFREPNLVYYKVPSPDVAGEYTCIPAWVLSVFSGQYYFVGQVLQNAMDGSIIRIEYNE